MKTKLSIILLFTLLCCFSSSYAFIDKTSEYSITIPDSFTKQTNEGAGNRYNSGMYSQSAFSCRAVPDDDLSNSYYEDIYSVELLEYLDSAFYKNVSTNPNCTEITLIEKKITTYNNYNAFYLCYSMKVFDIKNYMWEYIIFSDSFMYELVYSSTNEKYIESQEAKNIEESFQILDSMSFHDNSKPVNMNYNTPLPSSYATTYDSSSYNSSNYNDYKNDVPYGHLFVKDYIDYICIFILLTIIALILRNAILKKGKKVKALWFIVLMFVIQVFSLFGVMLDQRFSTPALNAFTIGEYLGYFLFSIVAIIVLLIQYIQSKK